MAKKKLEQQRTLRKVNPRLRLMLDAHTPVNIMRAELSGSISVEQQTLDKERVPLARGDEAVPVTQSEIRPSAKYTPSMGDATPDARFSVFVELRPDAASPLKENALEMIAAFDPDHCRKGHIIAADMKAEDIASLEKLGAVAYVATGETLTGPTPEIGAVGTAPPTTARLIPGVADHAHGAGVLVGIIDVQGFDFTHSDFMKDGETRWLRIWDQGGTSRPGPGHNGLTSFTYGSEILQQHMQHAIEESAAQGLPAYELEPQSQMFEGSHGTHVASIAAGNRGVARRAYLAGVLLALDESDRDRRKSFYDSTRIAHAVEYLFAVAGAIEADIKSATGKEVTVPVSINISLGTNGHAHDASSSVSRWIDYALTAPGRSVCTAAGNAGQAVAISPGDMGYVMGRVHAAGQFNATGLVHELEWNVVGNQIMDISENELEIWYGPSDRFSVDVVAPSGEVVGKVLPGDAAMNHPSHESFVSVAPGRAVVNHELADKTFVSIYNDLYLPANGANRIAIYLSPFFSFDSATGEARVIGIQAGLWRVRIHADQVRDGSYDAWIERDDPRRVGAVGDRQAWMFPSFFSERSHVDESTVSSLACGQRIVSVANLDEHNRLVNPTSSEGPTRDGRSKPEIGAPGTGILAARGFDPDSGWITMSGTSMASPYVAGVTALMLGIHPGLTAAQIGGMIQRTAIPLPGHDYSWRKDAGFGQIDPEACILEAKQFQRNQLKDEL